MPPKKIIRGSTKVEGYQCNNKNTSNNNVNTGIAQIVAQHLTTLMPTIVAQVARVMTGNNDNNNETIDNKGCTYQEFVKCEPKNFDGDGGALAYLLWMEEMEFIIDRRKCTTAQRVRYVTGSLSGRALTWWNTQVRIMGSEAVPQLIWDKFKALMEEEFYLRYERQKMEQELRNHKWWEPTMSHTLTDSMN